MLRYLSFSMAAVLVVVFFFNIGNIFNYDKGIEDIEHNSQVEAFNTLEWEGDREAYQNLKSIHQIPITGKLDSTNMSFTEPEVVAEGEEALSAEDNKKIFFFGKVDPVSGEDTSDDGWGEWLDDSHIATSDPETIEDGVTEPSNEPVEVTFDRFLKGE